MRYILQYILAIILVGLFSHIELSAQNEAKNFNVDSTLYTYYQHCKEYINDSIVLSMSDTLFNMAKVKNDKRMQAVALSTRLDYFFYQNNEEMIKENANRVMQFSKETNQSKYYYFAWGKRLIQYYINQNKTNIALYEAEKMLKEAEHDNDKIGIATCLRALSTIYNIRSQPKQKFKYLLEEVIFTEKYNLENYNISLLYTQLSSCYTNEKKYEEAFDYLKKAEAQANSVNHKFQVKLEFINYYLATNQTTMALKVLQDVRSIFNTEKSVQNNQRYLYTTEAKYYRHIGNYQKALSYLEKRIEDAQKTDRQAYIHEMIHFKANIYWDMNQKDSAAKYYRSYIHTTDSLQIINEEKNAVEFATLLNVEKLNSENNELILNAQKQKLRSRKTLIFSLIIILLLLCIFIYRERLMIKRLKRSEYKLQQRNKALTASKENLRKAKDNAEASSRMKTVFIQNISHEIRTPLNSIVGFSQILTTLVRNNDDAKEYSDIIITNSNNLLKLITDVLTISHLDTDEANLIMSDININLCCTSCMEFVEPLLQNGVKLSYFPDKGNISIIKTNAKGLSQILTNLLHNAAKFTEKGNISLSYTISEKEKTVTFSVTDTGKGIPSNIHKNIFERFIKLDEFSQGTGLGLSISKQFADKMNGTLFLDTNYTNGCRFVLIIPIK